MTQPMIVRDFQFTRDFRAINWRATLWYNLLRAAMAGVVLAGLQFVLPTPAPASALGALAIIPMMPAAYLVVILPMTMLVALLSRVPFVGLIGAAMALTVALGDPLVSLLKRVWPAAVPVDQPTLFSLTPVFWVLDADEYSIAG